MGDSGALDVPARTAHAELALPARLARPLPHPHETVEGVALARPIGIAAALGEEGCHLLAVEARDGAERRIRRDREVEVAVDVVDRAAVLQVADHLDDDRDRLDGPDVEVGRDDRQSLHVLAEQVGLSLGERLPVIVRRRGALEQGIVDVGDVLDVLDLAACGSPGANDEVERHVGVGVAHVGGVVRRDPADIEPGRLA